MHQGRRHGTLIGLKISKTKPTKWNGAPHLITYY